MNETFGVGQRAKGGTSRLPQSVAIISNDLGARRARRGRAVRNHLPSRLAGTEPPFDDTSSSLPPLRGGATLNPDSSRQVQNEAKVRKVGCQVDSATRLDHTPFDAFGRRRPLSLEGTSRAAPSAALANNPSLKRGTRRVAPSVSAIPIAMPIQLLLACLRHDGLGRRARA